MNRHPVAIDAIRRAADGFSKLRRRQHAEAAVSLRDFIRAAWHVVEPATPYVPNWHLDAIADHLEAVTRGDIRNLVINMPPRHMKSLAVSVFWPAWEWTFQPHVRWIFASYAQGLSTRDSVKCRRIIESPWYRREWGERFTLTGDQNVKTRYENTATGYRLATSVGGTGTGEGGDRIVCDDPHNVKQAESDAIREATLEWWDEVMSTRGNDPKTVARVIVAQRTHDADLSGHVLAQGGYEHLMLPAEYEPGQSRVTVLGWEDPRTEDGELLWDERFGRAEIEELKLRLGPYAAAAQLQQRPVPRGGGIFKRSWFRFFTPKTLPDVMDEILASWDMAFKATDGSSYVVGQVWGRAKANVYWLGGFRAKVEFPPTVRAVIALASPDQELPSLWRVPGLAFAWRVGAKLVEDKANGPAVIATLRGKVPGLIPIPGNDDKVARAHGVTWFVEAGNVFLPDPAAYPSLAEHVESFLFEIERYPRTTYTDQVIAFTQMLARVAPNAQASGTSATPGHDETILTEAAQVANRDRW